jgi:4-hydroxybenzoate polyprenyltransferase
MPIEFKLGPYVSIARFDHWFKNVFVLPGVIVALYVDNSLFSAALVWRLILALLAAGFVASSNYVLNEILDATKDALHPVKKNRPIPSGQVDIRLAYAEWVLLGVIGLAIASLLGLEFFLAALALWVMGCVYNVPPIRSKDQPYLDVLSESVNNPLRLLLGWYCTGIESLPPASLIAAYWMVGAFFMAVKRFAEYRRIDDRAVAIRYRSSFAHYNEQRLLVSIIYYGTAFGLFFGIFLMRYRLELILSIPLVAGFIAWYIHIGFKEDSPAQYPEQLYKQGPFVLFALLTIAVMGALLFIDVPIIERIFVPTVPIQGF